MKYDKSLFAGTAGYYADYRPKYPRVVFDKMIEVFKPNKGDVLLDLGCGTGEITLPLAKHFEKVLAWDPDGEMLEIAKRKTEEQGITNIIFEQKSSDDLINLRGRIKLCTMGQSFHWMGGADTLVGIRKHLVSGGGVTIIGVKDGLHIYSSTFNEPNEITAERNRVVGEMGIKYLGVKRKAGKSVFMKEEKSFEEILDEAGFTEIDEVTLDVAIKRTIDDVIGFIFSSSWGNKNQLGDKADAFERELREKLQMLKPDGIFDEMISFSLLTAKLPNEENGG
jgi:SAM-dependent methyltransferase